MANEFDQVQFFTIDDSHQYQRIDNYLMAKLKGVPKGKIYKILRKGEVRVNKKRAKPEYKLQIDDIVRVPPVRLEEKSEQIIDTAKLGFIEEAILFEDERIIVINKPSGIAVHGGSGLSYGLIEAIRALRPNAQFLELVHRLDKDTSGCMLIAKKRSALRHLHEQLRNKQMDKRYHALVDGTWPKNRHKVKAKLLKQQLQSGERMVFADECGKPSETHYRVLEHFASCSLVEAKPLTGRTHQIRVHCQYAGHSIANDPKYGNDDFSKFVRQKGCKRLFLHAQSLSFIHPLSEQVVTFKAEYDASLRKLINKMTGHLHATD